MYFPPSQIETNLYTKGGELSYASDGKEYIGNYFKTSKGKYYSGKNPNNPPNKLLTTKIPLEVFTLDAEINNPGAGSSDNNIYTFPVAYTKNNNLGLANFPPSKPKSFHPIPTKENYKLGEFQRYFTKKSNENLYIEVSQNTYKSSFFNCNW